MAKIFLDTGVLVYALDKNEPRKQKQARKILRDLVNDQQPVISTQVLKEFYLVATTKLGATPLQIKPIIHNLRNMEIVNNEPELIEQAIDISVLSQLSFLDALTIATAEKAKCEMIYSEALNAGQSYRGLKVENPFL